MQLQDLDPELTFIHVIGFLKVGHSRLVRESGNEISLNMAKMWDTYRGAVLHVKN